MKTKSIISKSWAVVAGVLLFTACSLEEFNPSGGPTAEEHYSTPEGYGELINACYFPLTRSWTGGGEDYTVYSAECGTDLWTCPKGEGWMKEIFYYTGLNGGTAHLNEPWQSSYESVNYCNAAIHLIDNAGFTNDAERNAKVAEAHFLRAFFNFFLVEQFGAVYLPLEETTSPITDVPRSSVAEFYNLIFADLKFAMQYLPKIQEERGRATRGAAYHLYAKASLQYASYDDVSNKTELYTDAKNAALELINNQASYGLRLYDDPSEVFDVANNKNNEEAIWVATHSQSSTLNPRGSKYWNRVYKQFGLLQSTNQCGIVWDINSEFVKCENRIMPTRALLDLYGNKDTRYDAYFRENYIANGDYTWSAGDCSKFGKDPAVFEGKKTISVGELGMSFTRQDIADPFSLDYACLDRDLVYNEDGTINTNYTNVGHPVLKKYEAPGMYAGELHKSFSWADHLVYRFAETYLLAAEACFRLGETPTAVTYFNVIRNRACENHDGSMNVAASDINTDFILAERGRELCGEYTRFMDLKRMGKTVFAQYVNSNPDIKARGAFNADVHFLRPIPEKSELNYQTNPEVFQNPGY
ncbi:RagB/SusD family nutrient uptake outer membrane protein [Gaoshiqia sediminis]|uniref:RagB/SusD family nutrient uptake outer membrane protein n=1 Tax=Gaoshiqia sediminis TaxID=2986998 RepID=A0AA41Y8W4_9BACT|nr:RagB/SusD family nutrient uptake outer membrane protein [Gaoshiqia sediminis]MCW0483103.1 RagB/SusD family nutrient uptake outer membrane protein [Gaoshiqia sediminis]